MYGIQRILGWIPAFAGMTLFNGLRLCAILSEMTHVVTQAADTPTLIREAEILLSESIWPRLEETCEIAFERVLGAFATHRVGEEHFASVTGYGHDDLGRAVTDKVFADVLQAEAAIVRPHFVSGTHAIAVALNAIVGHGDLLLSVTGRPYDTLEEVIGIRGESSQSLKARGVRYEEISVFGEDASISFDLFHPKEALIKEAKAILIQRSRGYSLRPSLTVDQIGELIAAIRAINPNAIIFVDNCYGEFTCPNEPCAVGADLVAGSLIKNPGGGIVPAGEDIAGRANLVQAAAEALTCPGIGPKGGYTFDLSRLILQGLFLAPATVKEALKGMTLAAYVFEQQGYKTFPRWDDARSDIIQVIELGDPDKLVRFCQTIQKASPINAWVTPIPCEVPGYENDVVMAGGTFIEGSTIELSADGPLRPPYVAYLQGGLHYTHVKTALKQVLENLQP